MLYRLDWGLQIQKMKISNHLEFGHLIN
jgi:hypothetical protein